ncbi:hypothetical protein [Streptomyces sp. NBC_01180]|uniref:hypothetical protein n=1 Tax=Streptomyces sp. NBC_01180 TaxID=2903763 RepID=UPI0038682276|nr:hypothetical protein OG708_03715 [Streptomyces sp. NBC_01180]
MWPGQQPPGGEQNPQDQNPNPYQQPGHQQPNPYQQGQPQPGPPQQGAPQGYQQPSPYQQPTVPQYAVGTPPGAPRSPEDRKKTTIIAIISATAVVAAAVITGVVVFKGDGDKGGTVQAGKSPSPSASASTDQKNPVPAPNPRAGGEAPKAMVAGWKVVVNPKWGTAFDVPPEWEVASSGTFSGFEDDKGKTLVGQSAPAFYKSKWCTEDSDKDGYTEDTGLGGAGTKGADGAKNTQDVAEKEVPWWVYGAYTQPNRKLVKTSKAKPYTTRSGVTGSLARAWATGVPKKSKCTTDGQAITFGFKNSAGDFVAFSLYNSTGVAGAIPQSTVDKILSTVRLAGKPTGASDS